MGGLARRLLVLVVVAALLGGSAAARSRTAVPHLPQAPNCPIFPPDSPWHTRIDRLPVARDSNALIRSIGLDASLGPGFGSGLSQRDRAPIGFPYIVVPGAERRVRVRFTWRSESDRGPYPIPKNVPIQGGRGSSGDRHAIIVDRDHCTLYELFALYPSASGWSAGSGAIWSLSSNKLRPDGWTSADAAGLPILPGLVRYDEVAHGAVLHALRLTVPRTRAAHVYPARHDASSADDADLPPMGARLRLRPDFDVSRFPKQARVVLVALKRYGMFVADNGLPWQISGVPSPHWDNAALATLGRVRGSDFEVVDTSSLPEPGT